MTVLGQMLVDSERRDGIRALVETCQEFGILKEEVGKKLEVKYCLTKEEARSYLNRYWK